MKLQRLVEGVGVDEGVETALMLHMSWTLKNSHLGRCPQVWRRREGDAEAAAARRGQQCLEGVDEALGRRQARRLTSWRVS